MRFPWQLQWTLTKYIVGHALRGKKRYPFVLMLEPTHLCNLACEGCGKIREFESTIRDMLPVETCLKAVEEGGAPIVSICGGEPTIYPHLDELGRALTACLPKNFPIAYKLALAFTIIISSGMAILGWVIAKDQTVMLEQQMIESSHTVVQQLAQIAKEPVLADDTLTLTLIVNHLHERRGLLAVAVYSDEITPIVQAGIVPDAALVADHATTNGMFLYSKAMNDEGEPVTVMASMSPMTVDGVTVGYALIGFDRSIVEAAKQKTIRTVGLATLLFVLFGSLASIILGTRLTRPIHQIIKISSAISAGNYDVRFTKPRNDELGELMKAMNAMTDGLAQKEHVEQTFSRYVAPQVAREVLKDTA